MASDYKTLGELTREVCEAYFRVDDGGLGRKYAVNYATVYNKVRYEALNRKSLKFPGRSLVEAGGLDASGNPAADGKRRVWREDVTVLNPVLHKYAQRELGDESVPLVAFGVDREALGRSALDEFARRDDEKRRDPDYRLGKVSEDDLEEAAMRLEVKALYELFFEPLDRDSLLQDMKEFRKNRYEDTQWIDIEDYRKFCSKTARKLGMEDPEGYADGEVRYVLEKLGGHKQHRDEARSRLHNHLKYCKPRNPKLYEDIRRKLGL